MPDLIAQGESPNDRWRRHLPDATPVRLGRHTEWSVPWDNWISREHVELIWRENRLRVRRLPEGRNPLFFRGNIVQECFLAPGDGFVIGNTLFRISEGTERKETPEGPPILQERAIAPDELHGIPFRDAPHRLDVLSHLPEVISSAADDTELYLRFINLLLAGIQRAEVVALVAIVRDEVTVLHTDQRRFEGSGFQPSHRLVKEAVVNRDSTVLHVWDASAGRDEASHTFTMQGRLDWAFCTPVRGESCPGWGIYVAGRSQGENATTMMVPWSENELGDDLKFAELAAAILSSLRQVQKLQVEKLRLSRFFSPAIQRVLADRDPEKELAPRKTLVTVMFCDMRGFTRFLDEKSEADELPAALDMVSRALGVMTQEILRYRGVVADFLGDAVLGFWGWPVADPDMTERACQAALAIHQYFDQVVAKDPHHPLHTIAVGIGLATGEAYAGRIGTKDQAKVTVFGRVANLSSRLEGLTGRLGVSILMDEPTDQVVRTKMSNDQAQCRRLARVRPYGMELDLIVSELLPGKNDSRWTPELLTRYEQALDIFLKGDWETAYAELHSVPAWDRAKDFLTRYILENNRTPPPAWNGVIQMMSKS